MIKEFDIKRWGATLQYSDSNNQPYPIVYISKSSDDMIPKPNSTVRVGIVESVSCYDGKASDGFIIDSAIACGYRPNFSRESDYIGIILMGTKWSGYPRSNGKIQIKLDDVGR